MHGDAENGKERRSFEAGKRAEGESRAGENGHAALDKALDNWEDSRIEKPGRGRFERRRARGAAEPGEGARSATPGGYRP
jgi:hypothetical protein